MKGIDQTGKEGKGGVTKRRRGQPYLQSAAARTMSAYEVAQMPDADAHKLFCDIRWADTGGNPHCPGCGCLAIYRHKKPDGTRPIFTCQACLKQFSATSGTIFHGRKMPIKKILYGIMTFVDGAKGEAALHLGRAFRAQHKTSFVMLHKLREALGIESDARMAEGVVEIDGANFGGYVKPENLVKDRVNRSLKENQSGKRRSVVVMRERGGRTLPFVVQHESQGAETIRKRVKPGSTVHADEAPWWNDVEYDDRFETKRINHDKDGYSFEGACTNGAEGYFSRLRRSEIGIHHHIAGPYLDGYAKEMAWREDARRIPNGTQFKLIVQAAALHPKSKRWCGYWQRRADATPSGRQPEES